jgi:tetratricopeptide (TPR) repeat protein
VAEETDQEHGAAATGGGVDPAALSIALGGASRAKADAFLDKQSLIADLHIQRMKAQDDHIEEEQRLQLSHLRIRRFSDYSKMALEIAAGLFLLAIVCGFGAMVWNAARDHSLMIETFIVPPDMATRGVTGHTVAAELLDKFAAMEAVTQPTAQGQGTYRLDAGDAIKIAISETGGLSLGELDRYLRETLGREAHVTGELTHSPRGLIVTVRAGGKPGTKVEGTETDLDGLMQKAAEALFAQSEPLRYADYLADRNRFAEAIARLRPLSLEGSPLDRARALTSWAEALDFDGDGRDALPIVEEAIRLVPNASFAWSVDSDIEIELGHDEAAHTAELRMIRTAHETWSTAELAASQLANLPFYFAQRRDAHEGDFAAAAEDWKQVTSVDGSGIVASDETVKLLEFARQRAAAHDIAGARQEVAWTAGMSDDPPRDVAYANAVIGFHAGDWRAVVDYGAQLEPPAKDDPYNPAWQRVQVRPLRAIAMARLRNFIGAEALILKTATDCDLCARARGQIAALKHDWRAVDYWFGMVAARSPSIPFADADWGEALRMKGDLDGAIAKFQQANVSGRHFADPLEMWGAALMLKNRSDLALAKFEDANRYAPNWGRLHLKWSEALGYVGRRDEAKQQFAIATHLDLSTADTAELSRVSALRG